jgi:hypothetical protein
MSTEALRAAVVHYLVVEVGDVGKTKLQKLLYFLQEAKEVPTFYPFRMHYYGPYSDEIDNDLLRHEAVGAIKIEADTNGYGYHITPIVELSSAEKKEVVKFETQIQEMLTLFGDKRAPDLELAATIHYAHRLMNKPSDEALAATVKGLKPQFSPPTILSTIHDLRRNKLL